MPYWPIVSCPIQHQLSACAAEEGAGAGPDAPVADGGAGGPAFERRRGADCWSAATAGLRDRALGMADRIASRGDLPCADNANEQAKIEHRLP